MGAGIVFGFWWTSWFSAGGTRPDGPAGGILESARYLHFLSGMMGRGGNHGGGELLKLRGVAYH